MASLAFFKDKSVKFFFKYISPMPTLATIVYSIFFDLFPSFKSSSYISKAFSLSPFEKYILPKLSNISNLYSD